MLGTLAMALGTLSIAVSGNHFVNGAGQTVRLLGVDHPGTEYACQQGWGYSDGDDDPAAAAADAAAIAAWNANAVRVPLNEDCWLGIDGQPSFGTSAGYQQFVEDWVADLNADGLYAILDLHWSAPGDTVADGQRPMPDSHSSSFWASVAQAFKHDPAVVFDAFNEPYSPAADFPDAAAYPLTWSCWESGGCTLPVTVDGVDPGPTPETYQAVGMQQLIDAIRATGADQPILLGGLSYSNDLSGWLAHEPTDPDHQLAASFHTYEGEACASLSCWISEVAPVAAHVPVVVTEFDGDQCPTVPGDDFDQTLMDWADAQGVSYLAWGWYAGSALDCSDTGYFLTDGSGDPVGPNGSALAARLAALGGPSSTPTNQSSGSTSGSGMTTNAPVNTGDPGSSAAASSRSQPAPTATVETSPGPARRCTVARLGGTLHAGRRRRRRKRCEAAGVRRRPRAAAGVRAVPVALALTWPT